MSKKRFSQDEKKYVISMFMHGISTAQIAEQMDVAESQVVKILVDAHMMRD